MDGVFRYLNTDLIVTSRADLTALANAFEVAGMYHLHIGRDDDGAWHASFELNQSFSTPELPIAAMLAAVELLDLPLRTIWDGCTRREFNIGYDCGEEPWAFNQGLSAELLGRMAAAGASLRITLYPDDRDDASVVEPEIGAGESDDVQP